MREVAPGSCGDQVVGARPPISQERGNLNCGLKTHHRPLAVSNAGLSRGGSGSLALISSLSSLKKYYYIRKKENKAAARISPCSRTTRKPEDWVRSAAFANYTLGKKKKEKSKSN